MKKELTRERLRELLDYDYFTGIFKWRVSRGRGVKAGDVAGTVNGRGYIQIAIDDRRYLAHRLAFLWIKARYPYGDVLHTDGNKTDNRWASLSEGSRAENLKDQKIHSNNTSGVAGVCWCKRDKKWQAQIRINRKQIHLGYFTNKADAIAARQAANAKYGFISRSR